MKDFVGQVRDGGDRMAYTKAQRQIQPIIQPEKRAGNAHKGRRCVCIVGICRLGP